MTSALLFVALLIVVDLSYRRWMRRSIARAGNRRPPPDRVIHLDATECDNDALAPRRSATPRPMNARAPDRRSPRGDRLA